MGHITTPEWHERLRKALIAEHEADQGDDLMRAVLSACSRFCDECLWEWEDEEAVNAIEDAVHVPSCAFLAAEECTCGARIGTGGERYDA